jgi:hypothetical protein
MYVKTTISLFLLKRNVTIILVTVLLTSASCGFSRGKFESDPDKTMAQRLDLLFTQMENFGAVPAIFLEACETINALARQDDSVLQTLGIGLGFQRLKITQFAGQSSATLTWPHVWVLSKSKLVQDTCICISECCSDMAIGDVSQALETDSQTVRLIYQEIFGRDNIDSVASISGMPIFMRTQFSLCQREFQIVALEPPVTDSLHDWSFSSVPKASEFEATYYISLLPSQQYLLRSDSTTMMKGPYNVRVTVP